ncbi:sugar transferase [Euzebyella marina]|uniref:Sugar transferase n=1 Tax=Euzebyella marina TaxID=1761453 RepID=A0A3G2L844_9FLAO|nr:sugar transferase [Euzebyella marina]AYN68448.1 sugar transferase [Euzebyella marina]MAU72701.1 lipid carrier--UDP-N-acetylgalactosaminyltransferase [Pseudozobellia sp.]MBG50382.1 lipid carrier--UDP-N-acetylgalactosaminyltransferase [Pseudozobellia sp.]|tara:strand:- start:311 stop:916 length:606 start_codon:yes stop_codon:yes gene_type:complete
MYRHFLKRVFDFLIAFFALLIASPILVLVTLLLSIANKGKVFFIQERPGKDERIFKIWKFKTMNDNRDSDGNLLSDKERLTNVGKFVRKTSLDELPQLFNVLKGDMSLIGPRPLLVSYLPLYNETQRRRHEVRPGITGWAQVNGRNAIAWEKKFEYDVYYVNNYSFLFDLRIILLTIQKVLKSDGINSTTSATMEVFTGTK